MNKGPPTGLLTMNCYNAVIFALFGQQMFAFISFSHNRQVAVLLYNYVYNAGYFFSILCVGLFLYLSRNLVWDGGEVFILVRHVIHYCYASYHMP